MAKVAKVPFPWTSAAPVAQTLNNGAKKQGLLLVTFKDAHALHPLAIERAETFVAQIALALRHLQMHEAWRLQLEAEQERQEQLRQLTLGLAEGEELMQQQLASQLQRGVGQNLTLLSVMLVLASSQITFVGLGNELSSNAEKFARWISSL